ncbi:MAG: hypothetical protein FGF50_11935 [Candidatus Brockarchaeota archaeon]|nr:hypothetical protein [Candidatus Brockarchaeota archaeon]
MINPELRKRFVDSIEYLRKMDFFKDYSDLSSEEILERIFEGEIDYAYWFQEWERKQPPEPNGSRLKRYLRENTSSWIRASNAEIDYRIIPFDTKRVVIEDPETWAFSDEMGIAILTRLARISRGVFQPTNITSRWSTEPEYKWSIQEVNFDFKGERHTIQIALKYDYFEDIGLEELNDIIRGTGYWYYQIATEYIMVVVLTKEEAEKLRKERGWRFEYTGFIYP